MSISKVTGRVIESNTIPEVETLEANTTQLQSDVTQINSSMGFKNRIIGGNFSTNPWQRGASISGPGGEENTYTADRFECIGNNAGIINVAKTADAPTAVQAGVFTQHCFHISVGTANASPASNEYFTFGQKIEGYNVLDLGFGQAGTRYFTLSFWHKHTKTGTNCVSFRNPNGDSYVAEYTQSVSDTWEKAEITVPTYASGSWDYTNGIGLIVDFILVAGSSWHTTSAETWQTGPKFSTATQVNNLDSTANNFKIALVQLEAGQTATRFETRSVGQELALCQRYFEKSLAIIYGTYFSVNASYATWSFKVQKRATPSVTGVGTTGVFQNTSKDHTQIYVSVPSYPLIGTGSTAESEL